MKRILYLSPVLFPVLTQAFSLNSSTLYDVIDEINTTIQIAIPILFSLAFIAFFWGLSKFILNSSNATDVQKGRSYMIWGVIALFVLISFRAIIGLIASDLGIGNGWIIPFIPTKNSNNYNNTTNTLNIPQGVPQP